MFETLPESGRSPASRTSGRRAGALSLAAHALVTVWATAVWTLGPDVDASNEDAVEQAGYAVLRYARVAVPAAARAAGARVAHRLRPPRLVPRPPSPPSAPAELDLAALTEPVVDEIGRGADAAARPALARRVDDFRPAAGGSGLAEAIARSVNRGRHGNPLLPTVDYPAIPLPDNPIPDYPASLLRAGVAGEVRVRFMIDTTGALDPRTVHVVSSSDERFTRAVRAVLPRLRFLPAESGGTKIAALSEQSFAFVVVTR